MKNTEFRVEDLSGNLNSKNNIIQDRLIKPIIFKQKRCGYYFLYKDKFN